MGERQGFRGPGWTVKEQKRNQESWQGMEESSIVWRTGGAQEPEDRVKQGDNLKMTRMKK